MGYAHRYVGLLLCAAAVLLSGCGDDDKRPTATRAAAQVTLTIVNRLSTYTIYYVYVSPSTENVWGADLLGAGRTLAPGQSVSLRLAPGAYDIKVVDEDLDTYVRWGVNLYSDFTWVVTLSDMTSGKPVVTDPAPAVPGKTVWPARTDAKESEHGLR
ncbi:MAG: hypothetical protein AB1505_36895 [Candidatus Latescibacterota bacterium]